MHWDQIPTSYQVICIYHLMRNAKKYFKDGTVRRLSYDASRTFRESKFQWHWEQVVNHNNGFTCTVLEDADVEH